MSGQGGIAEPLRRVAEAFGELGVRFYVGGSVASSYHGAPRSTMDVDLVAELAADAVPRFLEFLGDEYYASLPAILEAVDRRASFNLVYLPLSYKVDVFVSRDREYDRAAFSRVELCEIHGDPMLVVPIASAEDVIVSKLARYRLGNEISERQWLDARSVLDVQGETTDRAYLHKAASQLGVQDLLERLLASADNR